MSQQYFKLPMEPVAEESSPYTTVLDLVSDYLLVNCIIIKIRGIIALAYTAITLGSP